MARDNHNAGLHLIPKNWKVSFDTVDRIDKYVGTPTSSAKEIFNRKPFVCKKPFDHNSVKGTCCTMIR